MVSSFPTKHSPLNFAMKNLIFRAENRPEYAKICAMVFVVYSVTPGLLRHIKWQSENSRSSISWNPVAIAEWLALTRSANGRARFSKRPFIDFRSQFAHEGVEIRSQLAHGDKTSAKDAGILQDEVRLCAPHIFCAVWMNMRDLPRSHNREI